MKMYHNHAFCLSKNGYEPEHPGQSRDSKYGQIDT